MVVSEEVCHTKCLFIALLVDISGSMAFGQDVDDPAPIDEMVHVLPTLLEELGKIRDHKVEVTLLTFAEQAQVAEPFAEVSQFTLPHLAATGAGTNLGGGVGLALDVLQSRREAEKKSGMECSKPWLVLMTDGKPNENSFVGFEDELRKEVETLQLHLVPVSIGTGAATETLRALSPLLEPIHIGGGGGEEFSWKQFFRFLGTSIASGETRGLEDAFIGPRTADMDEEDSTGAAVLK